MRKKLKYIMKNILIYIFGTLFFAAMFVIGYFSAY